MGNSPLVSYTKISPNRTSPRNHVIDTITPHCVVGQYSVEALGDIFAPATREASSNYGIGVDGRVGMYCEEKDRSWCTSSSSNDNRAVTIECASDSTEPYAFKEIVYNKLIELCADICRRNGKTKLLWLGDKNTTLNYNPAPDDMLLTVHRWFANKSCPGNWMYSKMGDLAEKVTEQLGNPGSSDSPKPEPEKEATPSVLYRVQVGAYSFIANALAQQKKLKAAGFDTYLVKTDDGMYKVQVGAYSKYENAEAQVNKVKAAGFSCFITTKSGTPVDEVPKKETPKEIPLKKLDKVRLTKDATVYGKSETFQPWVYKATLYVREINGDRIVVSTQKTGAITGAVHKNHITKI